MLAREARIYIYHVAGKLAVQVKGAGLADGIETLSKAGPIEAGRIRQRYPGTFGGSLGRSGEPGWRYWFYGADYALAAQLAYLKGLKKVTEQHLQGMIAGKTVPQEFAEQARRTEAPRYFESRPGEFRILDYVEVRRQVGRNWVTRCPSCAAQGHDKSGDNLAISVEEPRKYCCWAGCTREMIRAAVGRPIPDRRLA